MFQITREYLNVAEKLCHSELPAAIMEPPAMPLRRKNEWKNHGITLRYL
jgi:hypothetical protein